MPNSIKNDVQILNLTPPPWDPESTLDTAEEPTLWANGIIQVLKAIQNHTLKRGLESESQNCPFPDPL